jgi:hypothetical protein
MRCSRTLDPVRIRSGRPGPGPGRCGPVDVGSGQPPGLQERRDQQHAVKAAAQFLPAGPHAAPPPPPSRDRAAWSRCGSAAAYGALGPAIRPRGPRGAPGRGRLSQAAGIGQHEADRGLVKRSLAGPLSRPSRPGRRAPPATRSGQPGKPGGSRGHGMNDGLRGTQGALAPGGVRARARCVRCHITRPVSYVAIMSQNSRIAESASVFAARICSACRLCPRGCQKAAGSR